MTKAKLLSEPMLAALREIGITPENTRRVVIDIQTGHVPVVHIEQFGDSNLLSVVRALDGIEITRGERQVVKEGSSY